MLMLPEPQGAAAAKGFFLRVNDRECVAAFCNLMNYLCLSLSPRPLSIKE
jgi:hypothetical protein